MKKILLIATIIVVLLSGCTALKVYVSERSFTVCGSLKKGMVCPPRYTEVKGEKVYAPLILLTGQVKTCINYDLNEAQAEFEGFKCKTFFE